MIEKFRDEYRWLSNFHTCEHPLFLEGDNFEYPSVEHAYQAAKTFNVEHRWRIRCGDATFAKRYFKTRSEAVRPDWDQVKLMIMEKLLRQKFKAGTGLLAKLIATGKEEIVEGNTWGDVFWGQCPIGKGENHLGKLLMQIRSEALFAEALNSSVENSGTLLERIT